MEDTEKSLLKRFSLGGEVCLHQCYLLCHMQQPCSYIPWLPLWCCYLKWQFPLSQQSQCYTQQHWCREAISAQLCLGDVCNARNKTKQHGKGCMKFRFHCSSLQVLATNLPKDVGLCLHKSTIFSYHMWSNASHSTIKKIFKKQLSVGNVCEASGHQCCACTYTSILPAAFCSAEVVLFQSHITESIIYLIFPQIQAIT